MRPRIFRLACLVAAAAAAAGLAGCGTGGPSGAQASKPIVIGISLPLNGSFQTDGVAFDRGYHLWQSVVNDHGGIQGRRVKLIILNDKSSPNLAESQYRTLIQKDHVNLTFGPFSSLLTAQAEQAVGPLHFAFIEGAGDAESVFQSPANEKYHNIISPSLPVKDYMAPFDAWIKSLPASKRPKTAAFPSVFDPFAFPAVQTAQRALTALGIKVAGGVTSLCNTNVSGNATPKCLITEAPKYYPAAAKKVAQSGAQIVVLGSTDVPTVAEFMKVFEQNHYTPKIFIAVSGPDQGSAFLGPVGLANANDMMVPNGWFGGYQNALNNAMVEEYIARYGGTAASINADVAEAYSVGEVAEDAISATNSTSNAKILAYLHNKHTLLNTVQGEARFDKLGRNPLAVAFISQWQGNSFVQVLGPAGVKLEGSPRYPKPAFGS